MLFIPMTAGKGAHQLAIELQHQLQDGKRILWLISGGTNIPLTVQIMDELPANLTKQLTIMPIDERYGPPGHADSNMKHLYDAGFPPKEATIYNPLDGSPITTAVKRYNDAMQKAFDASDVVVAQVGMGSGGHIAGLMPHSMALTAKTLVTSYKAFDFERMTLTPVGFRHIDQAYLFAYGRPKRASLDRLCDGDITIDDQPAQILRELRDVTVYNDQLEERNA